MPRMHACAANGLQLFFDVGAVQGGGGLSDGDSRRARKKSLPPKSCVQIPFTEAQFPNDGTPQDPLALALGLPLPLP